MESNVFFQYFNRDINWFNKFYRSRGYNLDNGLNDLTKNDVEEGYNDQIYTIADFRIFIVDCCFFMGERLHEELQRLLNQMDASEQTEFLHCFRSILEGVELNRIITDERVLHQRRGKIGETKFVQGKQLLSNLPSWLEKILGQIQSESRDLSEETPLFRWEGERTDLVELILFLSATGWINVNPDLKYTKALCDGLAKIFVVYDQRNEKYVPIKPASLQKYLTSLELNDINEIDVEEIFKIHNDKFNPTKETASFKGIKPRKFS